MDTFTAGNNMQDKLAQYYYNLGAELALQHSGLEKTANLRELFRLFTRGTPQDLKALFKAKPMPGTSRDMSKIISRLQPLGGRSIGSGAAFTGLGAGLGVGADLLAKSYGLPSMGATSSAMLGGALGKIVKDRRTVGLAKSLTNAEKALAAKHMTYNPIRSTLYSGIGTMNPAGALSDLYTNSKVRNILGAKTL